MTEITSIQIITPIQQPGVQEQAPQQFLQVEASDGVYYICDPSMVAAVLQEISALGETNVESVEYANIELPHEELMTVNENGVEEEHFTSTKVLTTPDPSTVTNGFLPRDFTSINSPPPALQSTLYSDAVCQEVVVGDTDSTANRQHQQETNCDIDETYLSYDEANHFLFPGREECVISTDIPTDIPIPAKEALSTSAAKPQKRQRLNEGKTVTKQVFKCPQEGCTFWAARGHRFHEHMCTHEKIRPFGCSACTYETNWKSDVKKHIARMMARSSDDHDHAVLRSLRDEKVDVGAYRKYIIELDVPCYMHSGRTNISCRVGGAEIEELPSPSPSPPVTANNSKPKKPKKKKDQDPLHIKAKPLKKIRPRINKTITTRESQIHPMPMLTNGWQELEVIPVSPDQFSSTAPLPPPSVQNEINVNKPQKVEKLNFLPEIQQWKCTNCTFTHSNRATVLMHLLKFHNLSGNLARPILLNPKPDPPTTSTLSPQAEQNVIVRGAGNQYYFMVGGSSNNQHFQQTKPMDTTTMKVAGSPTGGSIPTPVNCTLCPYIAKNLSDWTFHRESHYSTDEKLTYACPDCGFRTATRMDNAQHRLLHGPSTTKLLVYSRSRTKKTE